MDADERRLLLAARAVLGDAPTPEEVGISVVLLDAVLDDDEGD